MTWPQEAEAETGGRCGPVIGVKNRKLVERGREGEGKGEGWRGRERKSLTWPRVHLASLCLPGRIQFLPLSD